MHPSYKPLGASTPKLLFCFFSTLHLRKFASALKGSRGEGTLGYSSPRFHLPAPLDSFGVHHHGPLGALLSRLPEVITPWAFTAGFLQASPKSQDFRARALQAGKLNPEAWLPPPANFPRLLLSAGLSVSSGVHRVLEHRKPASTHCSLKGQSGCVFWTERHSLGLQSTSHPACIQDNGYPANSWAALLDWTKWVEVSNGLQNAGKQSK